MRSVFPIDGQHDREDYRRELETALRGYMVIEIYFTRRVIEVTAVVEAQSEVAVRNLIESVIKRVEST